MNREFLREQGLTDEQVEAVIQEHGKVVNDTKGKLDTVTTDRDSLKEQLADRDTQLEELKKVDAEGLQAKIDELQQVNETTKTEYEAKLQAQAFEFTLEKALSTAGAKNAKAVKALLDTENIKLDGETLLGLDDQLKALQESDPYLFGEDEPPGLKGRKPNEGGTNTQGIKNPFSKEHFNLTEQAKLLKENPDLAKQLQNEG